MKKQYQEKLKYFEGKLEHQKKYIDEEKIDLHQKSEALN